MKFSLLVFALFSTTVFAIGTNELTGTFEVKTEAHKYVPGTNHLTGASEKMAQDKSRMPASVTEEKENFKPYTELTGTFE